MSTTPPPPATPPAWKATIAYLAGSPARVTPAQTALLAVAVCAVLLRFVFGMDRALAAVACLVAGLLAFAVAHGLDRRRSAARR